VAVNRLVWSIFNWKISVQIPYLIFVCFAVLLCITLANWQWQRAQAADSLLSSYQLQESRPESILSKSPEAYQKVVVTGEIKNHFFLDNQIYRGFAGWHVIAELDTKQYKLLVDLGWQPKNDDFKLSSPLPELVEIRGLIRQPQKGLILQSVDQDPNWPILQQQIDIALLNKHFGYELFPFILHAENQVSSLIPQPIEMENKYFMHIGYAIQWLLIAAACFIGFLYISRAEQKEYERKK